jgi:hypothetical protein
MLECCRAARIMQKTATNGKSKKTIPIVAPKLRCFTVARSDGAMLSETMMNSLEKLFDQRKACVHWSYHSPMCEWLKESEQKQTGKLSFYFL